MNKGKDKLKNLLEKIYLHVTEGNLDFAETLCQDSLHLIKKMNEINGGFDTDIDDELLT